VLEFSAVQNAVLLAAVLWIASAKLIITGE
jgi:hypothetical protein